MTGPTLRHCTRVIYDSIYNLINLPWVVGAWPSIVMANLIKNSINICLKYPGGRGNNRDLGLRRMWFVFYVEAKRMVSRNVLDNGIIGNKMHEGY